MLNLFNRNKGSGDVATNEPIDIKWVRTAKGQFHNLMFLDTLEENLDKADGIYAIWQGGAKPQWLYLGASKDLAKALDEKIDDPDYEALFDRTSVYVTWSLVKREYQDSILRYLNDIMNPRFANPDRKRWAKEKPTAVHLPG